MSNLRKSALAVAVLAGLALSGVASAYTVTNNGTAFTTEGIAYFDVPTAATTNVGIWRAPVATFQASDNIIGRTTGFALRVTLSNGAMLGPAPAISGTLGGLAIGSAAGWSASASVSGNILIVTFTPSSGAPAIAVGDSIALGASGAASTELAPTPGELQFNTVQALATSGSQVQGSFQFYDPVTTNPILGAQTVTILQSGNPVATSATASTTSAKIDVGATPSQAFLSPCGAIGGSSNPGCTDTGGAASTSTRFDSGAIGVAVSSPATGPDFSYFTFAATDSYTTTLTGNFSAFAQTGSTIALYPSTNCSGTAVATAATPTGNTATMTFTAAGPFTYELCLTEPGSNTMPIAATSLSASTSFTRGTMTVSGGTAQPLAPLAYNAPVVHVYTFNPAGNTTQQSFLRVSNTGTSGGLVTITGTDDAGNAGAGPVTFTLGAGQSVQLPSSCLQSGASCPTGLTVNGALGTGTGKWRLTVFSYFPDLVVTSLNRNNNTGTVTNLTKASIGQ
ncbi:MAG: hypothetical protein M0Z99_05245 [Betaproteobacteria bacterium]|nr:hypothetical protein [Betaproteobacteria bacterium]